MNKENNKIIAEFMIKQEPTQNFCVGSIGRDGIGIFTGIQTEYFKVEELKFNSDWNWLMEVVEKIESIDFEVSIRGNSVTVVNNSGKNPYFQPHSVKATKIESIYEACVKFIKRHNEQQKA